MKPSHRAAHLCARHPEIDDWIPIRVGAAVDDASISDMAQHFLPSV